MVSRDALDPERVMAADQVLVGRNNTRRAYNMRIREKQDILDPLPVAGDKLVCLRNNRKKALFNGGLWRVKARATSKSHLVTMRLTPDEDLRSKPVKVTVRPECFAGGIEDFTWDQRKPYDEFDFGYVLTVHKNPKARSGTTSCCSTRVLPFRIPARAGSIRASRVPRSGCRSGGLSPSIILTISCRNRP